MFCGGIVEQAVSVNTMTTAITGNICVFKFKQQAPHTPEMN